MEYSSCTIGTKVFCFMVISNKHFKLINRFHKIKDVEMVCSKSKGRVQLDKMCESAVYCNCCLTVTAGYGFL